MFFRRTDVAVSFAGEHAYRLDVDAASVLGVSAPDVWIVYTLCSHLWGGRWFCSAGSPMGPFWWWLVGCPHGVEGMAGS